MVPRVSAVVSGHADAESIAIYADHINMVKFKSVDDPGYSTISGHLNFMANDATRRIQERWEIERRLNNCRIS